MHDHHNTSVKISIKSYFLLFGVYTLGAMTYTLLTVVVSCSVYMTTVYPE